MSKATEKTFTVVGTAINASGDLKMRWANDLVLRLNILIKGKCEDINLHETPKPMTKLESAEWLLANIELTTEQNEVVPLKIAEKAKIDKREKAKAVMTSNVKSNVAENKPVDPRVAEFIKQTISDEEPLFEIIAPENV